MDSCMACDLADGKLPLPGGRIHETTHWLVEHCVGPLGLGTLIVKPRRHLTSVADLTDAEAAELGPLLRTASVVAGEVVPSEQIYNCLWSHAGGTPVHIHYVVQPVTADLMKRHGAHGPVLQVAMFVEGDIPQDDQIEDVASRAKAAFDRRAGVQVEPRRQPIFGSDRGKVVIHDDFDDLPDGFAEAFGIEEDPA